jgi:hypothetical protein
MATTQQTQQSGSTSTRLRGSAVGAALASLALAGPAFGQARPVSSTAADRPGADAAPSMGAVRAATDRFRDVKVALAEGYVRDPASMCVTAEMEGMPRQLGEMGIHYFRPDLLGITAPPNPRVSGTGTHTDFRTPGVLIYEPQMDGSLRLVAVENLVFERAWRTAGQTEPPQYAGNAYYHMVDNPLTAADEAHGFEPHYELHAWLYRENPNGTFAQFNPRVTCRHHVAARAHERK